MKANKSSAPILCSSFVDASAVYRGSHTLDQCVTKQLTDIIHKSSPRFSDDLQRVGITTSNLEVADTAMKTFYQTNSADTKVFTRLVDEEKGTSSTITVGMLMIAKTCYNDFYGASEREDYQRLDAFLTQVANLLKESEMRVLDRPFRTNFTGHFSLSPNPESIS